MNLKDFSKATHLVDHLRTLDQALEMRVILPQKNSALGLALDLASDEFRQQIANLYVKELERQRTIVIAMLREYGIVEELASS